MRRSSSSSPNKTFHPSLRRRPRPLWTLHRHNLHSVIHHPSVRCTSKCGSHRALAGWLSPDGGNPVVRVGRRPCRQTTCGDLECYLHFPPVLPFFLARGHSAASSDLARNVRMDFRRGGTLRNYRSLNCGAVPGAARYSGISFGYQGAGVIGGGLAPIIATALTQWAGGASWPVATYLAGIALIGLVAVCLASDKYRMKIHDRGPTEPRLASERR